MSRKLASAQRIISIKDIEGSDKVQLAQCLGWQLVIPKDVHKVNELVCYVEIDSLLPIGNPQFEFLRKNCYKKMADGKEGFRIRTARIRQQISQGIIFPLSILNKKTNDSIEIYIPAEEDIDEDGNIKEGTDLTQALGIIKYEPPVPACLSGVIKGLFPSFLQKTDEQRVQTLQNELNEYKGTKCYITEKVDGSSISFFLKDGVFGVCSRNLELTETEGNTTWKLAREMQIEEKLREEQKQWSNQFCLQGEIYGEGINANPLKLKGQHIRFFNIFDIDRHIYLDYKVFLFVLNRLELESVPVLSEDFVLINDIPELVKLATRKSAINPEVWAEGIVIRSLEERYCPNVDGGRLSFKVLNPEYLLKYEE